MAKKAKIERRAKPAESLQIEEADIQVIRDTRSAWLRILDHITEKGIYAIILFVPLAFLPDTHWLFDLTRVGILRILTLLVLAAYLCRIAISREWRIVLPPHLVLWPILAYVAIYTVSTIFSISPNLSLFSGEGRNFGLISLLNMILLYFLVINVMTDRRRLMRCLTMLVASATVVALLGFYQFYGHSNPEGSGAGINESHLKIVLGVAVCVAIVFFYLAVFYTRAAAEKRVWFAVVFAIALALVLGLAFDLSKDTNAFGPSDDESVFYAQIYEEDVPTGVYTNHDYTWEQCDDDGKSVARLDGIHQMAPMMVHRTSATFGNPDFLIPFLILIIPVATAFVLKRKWLYVAPLLVLGLCFSMSVPYEELVDYWILFLGGVAALIVITLGMYVPKRYLLYYVLIFLLLVTSVVGANVGSSRSKIWTFAEDHLGLDPDDDRAHLSRIAWATLDSPKNEIIGSGPNTFRDTFTQHVPLDYSQGKPDRREDKVHMSFIEALATTGWLGLISYICMFGALLWYLFRWLLRNREKSEYTFIALILISILIYIFFSASIFHTVVPYTFFWILVAIGVGLTVVDGPSTRTIDLNISKMFSYGLVGVFLAVSVFGGCLAARPVVADHYYQKGLRVGNCGDNSSVVNWYKKAHQWNGYEIHYNLDYAYSLLQEAVYSQDPDVIDENCRQVLEVMNASVDQEPDSAMIYFNRAQMMNGCGYEQDAVLADALTTVEMYPNGYLGFWFVAELLTERGDPGDLESAVVYDEAAFEIVPRYLSGIMKTKVSEYTKALVRFGRNQMALGAQYKEDGDSDGAQDQFENAVDTLAQVVEMDPGDAGAKFFLGRAYEESGDLEGAHRQYEEVVEILLQLVESHPDDDAIHYFLGAAYEGLSEFDKAEEEYKTALGINPNLQEAKNGLERVQEKRGEVDGL